MEKVRDGVNGIRAQLVSVLEKAGLERIEADGAVFDPNEHEAVMQDDGDAEPRRADDARRITASTAGSCARRWSA